jgi:hypothetical protein
MLGRTQSSDDVLTAAMKLGDLVLYEGKTYYLRGLDPMSVPDRRVFLEDAQTGDEVSAPVTEVEPIEDDEPGGTAEV